MHYKIKTFTRKILLLFGIYISKIKPTSKEALYDFFDTLRANSRSFKLVRVGVDGDGGYLVPDDFRGIGACFSPGVANSSKFEFQLASNYGIECFLADFSVNSPAESHCRFHFTKKFINSFNDEQNMRLDDWISQCEGRHGNGDFLLQMDVEGAEYSILQDFSEKNLAKVRILVIEFHSLDKIFDRNEFALVKQIFDKVLKYFYIVHIHPNNSGYISNRGCIEVPTVLEFTFLRRDRVKNHIELSFEKHPLDRPNAKCKPDLVLPKCWRKSAS